jgi:hypothetical protein
MIKNTLQCKKSNGFITLEIIIAMTILVLTLSATTLLFFGNLSIVSDGERNREAQGILQAMLGTAREISSRDFKQSIAIKTNSKGNFLRAASVTNNGYFSKKITATVSWSNVFNREQQISSSEVITDYQNTSGGDTCDGELIGDWTHPHIVNSILDFATLLGASGSVYSITDIDAYRGKLYVTTNNTSVNQETFFIFDIKNPAHPTLISKLDNDLVNNTGIKAISVYGNKYEQYAYVANSSSFVKGQLQIIDIANTHPSVIATYKISTNIVSGSSSQGNGNSIFYKDGYVYLGLTKTVSGPEFNIIDVHDPFSPVWVGGYSVGNSINNILIRDGFAYLATPNNRELILLDITNPTHPTLVGGFDAPDSVGSGKSLYLVGNTLYLGRTATASHPELYLIDSSNPLSIHDVPLGTKEIGSSINSLLVRSNLLFLITTSGQLQIYDIASSSAIVSASAPIMLPNSGSGTAMDCEGNTIFVASMPNTGIFGNKSSLSIITAN